MSLAEIVASAKANPPRMLVSDLIPESGSMKLLAKAKSGKTTFLYNLIASMVDDELFLGRPSSFGRGRAQVRTHFRPRFAAHSHPSRGKLTHVAY